MDLSDNDVRKRLEIELFVGFDDDDPRDKIPEKLLQLAIVNEEKRTKDKAFFKSGDNSSEGEDDEKKDRVLTSIICITSTLTKPRLTGADGQCERIQSSRSTK